jgi:hypothetical protein
VCTHLKLGVMAEARPTAEPCTPRHADADGCQWYRGVTTTASDWSSVQRGCVHLRNANVLTMFWMQGRTSRDAALNFESVGVGKLRRDTLPPNLVPDWFLVGSYLVPDWFLVGSYLFPRSSLLGSYVVPTRFLIGSWLVPTWFLIGSWLVPTWFLLVT